MVDCKQILREDYPDDADMAEVVGVALNSLERDCGGREIRSAIRYFERNREALEKMPRRTRREAIQAYVSEGRDLLAPAR